MTDLVTFIVAGRQLPGYELGISGGIPELGEWKRAITGEQISDKDGYVMFRIVVPFVNLPVSFKFKLIYFKRNQNQNEPDNSAEFLWERDGKKDRQLKKPSRVGFYFFIFEETHQSQPTNQDEKKGIINSMISKAGSYVKGIFTGNTGEAQIDINVETIVGTICNEIMKSLIFNSEPTTSECIEYYDAVMKRINSINPKSLGEAFNPFIKQRLEKLLTLEQMQLSRKWKVINLYLLRHDFPTLPNNTLEHIKKLDPIGLITTIITEFRLVEKESNQLILDNYRRIVSFLVHHTFIKDYTILKFLFLNTTTILYTDYPPLFSVIEKLLLANELLVHQLMGTIALIIDYSYLSEKLNLLNGYWLTFSNPLHETKLEFAKFYMGKITHFYHIRVGKNINPRDVADILNSSFFQFLFSALHCFDKQAMVHLFNQFIVDPATFLVFLNYIEANKQLDNQVFIDLLLKFEHFLKIEKLIEYQNYFAKLQATNYKELSEQHGIKAAISTKIYLFAEQIIKTGRFDGFSMQQILPVIANLRSTNSLILFSRAPGSNPAELEKSFKNILATVQSLSTNQVEFLCKFYKWIRDNQVKLIDNLKNSSKFTYLEADISNHELNILSFLEQIKSLQFNVKEGKIITEVKDKINKLFSVFIPNSDFLHKLKINLDLELDKLKDNSRIFTDLMKLNIFHSFSATEEEMEQEHTHKIFITEELEEYLHMIKKESIKINEIIKLKPPMVKRYASWIVDVKKSNIFTEFVWKATIEKNIDDLPVPLDEFERILEDTAAQWKELAECIGEGEVSFVRLDKLFEYKLSSTFEINCLSNLHLDQNTLVRGVKESVEDFITLKSISKHVRRFFEALSRFKIKDRSEIEVLKACTNKLEQEWDETTIQSIRKDKLIETLTQTTNKSNNFSDKKLNIIELKKTMEFIGSLVEKNEQTGKYEAPLIEWLISKADSDMDSIGRIIQSTGTTLRIYFNMLQTLRTRIIEFLQQTHDNLYCLLSAVEKSEIQFRKIHASVQPIDIPSLVSRLPDIDIAVEAATISPYENAKEHVKLLNLLKLSSSPFTGVTILLELLPKHSLHNFDQSNRPGKVTTSPKANQLDDYNKIIFLKLDEIKQDLQLLEMGRDDEDDFKQSKATPEERLSVQNALKILPLVLEIYDLFTILYEIGHISYRLIDYNKSIECNIPSLSLYKQKLQNRIKEWNLFLQEIEKYPLLSRIPRQHLLSMSINDINKATHYLSNHLSMFLKQEIPLQKYELKEIVDEYQLQLNSLKQNKDVKESEKKKMSEKLLNLKKFMKNIHNKIIVKSESFKKQLQIKDSSKAINKFLSDLTSEINRSKIQILLFDQNIIKIAMLIHICWTKRAPDPAHLLVISSNTKREEIEQILKLWQYGDYNHDIFTILEVDKLVSIDYVRIIREYCNKINIENSSSDAWNEIKNYPPLLLITNSHKNKKDVQNSKSMKMISTQLNMKPISLNYKVPDSDLFELIHQLLPMSKKMHFYTSHYPGSGKTHAILKHSKEKNLSYYRIPIREGSTSELVSKLNNSIESLKVESEREDILIHLDVSYSANEQLSTSLLSILLGNCIYHHENPNSYWNSNEHFNFAIEFYSPFQIEKFPIVELFAPFHHDMQVSKFAMDVNIYKPAPCLQRKGFSTIQVIEDEIRKAAWFLDVCKRRDIVKWNIQVESFFEYGGGLILIDPADFFLSPSEYFDLFVNILTKDNRKTVTFTSIFMLQSYINKQLPTLLRKSSSVDEQLLFEFFNFLFYTSSSIINRSIEMDKLIKPYLSNESLINAEEIGFERWENRTRALLIIHDGICAFGSEENELKSKFSAESIQLLQANRIVLSSLSGSTDLLQSNDRSSRVLLYNTLFSILSLGSGDSEPSIKMEILQRHSEVNAEILAQILSRSSCSSNSTSQQKYALTGDNLLKMLVILTKLHCRLPVIIFGEAGVGKSLLLRYLIEIILEHTFVVVNVHSGTTMEQIIRVIDTHSSTKPVYIFFDEFNTADPMVISMIKEIICDRHCNGLPVSEDMYFLAAANPYRMQENQDEEFGLMLFQFANQKGMQANEIRKLVYRVNRIPISMFDHIYDYGELSIHAASCYLKEMVTSFANKHVQNKEFANLLVKCHEGIQTIDRSSTVSLRDASRANILCNWFKTNETGRLLSQDGRYANQLSIYLSYAFRFNGENRLQFLNFVFGNGKQVQTIMKQSAMLITDKLYKPIRNKTSIGAGAIALNTALCENLFAAFVCVLNSIFVIIVGRPGTSKSLSLEILKKALSADQHQLRKELGGLPPITSQYFQCSPLSTSSGFEMLFDSARKLASSSSINRPLVILDELGLADLSPDRPMKVLHSELERESMISILANDSSSLNQSVVEPENLSISALNNQLLKSSVGVKAAQTVQQQPISVVALSNWVVDSAQVNRGILIRRTSKSTRNDLRKSAKAVAEALFRDESFELFGKYIDIIVDIYIALDENELTGGGHMISLRDFFFTVKNFIVNASKDKNRIIAYLLHSIYRNLTGHPNSKLALEKLLTVTFDKYLPSKQLNEIRQLNEENYLLTPFQLIVENIKDSTADLAVHIARPQMLISKSLIALPLLMNHIKPVIHNHIFDANEHSQQQQLPWEILFGSFFKGDSKLLAITRKLRQIEQAIRKGGILILCHAEQLFESLYILLNQQYWAQGNVRMTEIALGPSTRPIALPEGHFRIIVCIETDKALSREHMSPAVLSRFEKHQITAECFLNDDGKSLLQRLYHHPVIHLAKSSNQIHQLIYGYHDDLLPSLALILQSQYSSSSFDPDTPNQQLNVIKLMNEYLYLVYSPLIFFDLYSNHKEEVEEYFLEYKNKYLFRDIDDIVENRCNSKKLIVITHTLPRSEIVSIRLGDAYKLSIQDFDTEVEFTMKLDEIVNKKSQDRKTIILQHDATIPNPIEMFQFAKYEIEKRLIEISMHGGENGFNTIFIIHIDPKPNNNNWSFSFEQENEWEYIFIEDLISRNNKLNQRLPLVHLLGGSIDPSEDDSNSTPYSLPHSPDNTGIMLHRYLEDGIMNIKQFISLINQIVGPSMKKQLDGVFNNDEISELFKKVRELMVYDGNENNYVIFTLIKKYLIQYLKQLEITWDPLLEFQNEEFERTDQLSSSLWKRFIAKLTHPLKQLIIFTDVWKLDKSRKTFEMNKELVVEFLHSVFNENQLLSFIQMQTNLPTEYLITHLPLSYLFNSIFPLSSGGHKHISNKFYDLLCKYPALHQPYFTDWLLLNSPAHFHLLLNSIPASLFRNQCKLFYTNYSEFVEDWNEHYNDIMIIFEFYNIVFLDTYKAMHNSFPHFASQSWKSFISVAIEKLLDYLMKSIKELGADKIVEIISFIENDQRLNRKLEDYQGGITWKTLQLVKQIILFNHYDSNDVPQSYPFQNSMNALSDVRIISHWRILMSNRSITELILSINEFIINYYIIPQCRLPIDTKKLNEVIDYLVSTNRFQQIDDTYLFLSTCNKIELIADIHHTTHCPNCNQSFLPPPMEADAEGDQEEDVEIAQNKEIIRNEEINKRRSQHFIHIPPNTLKQLEKLVIKFQLFFEQIILLLIPNEIDHENRVLVIELLGSLLHNPHIPLSSKFFNSIVSKLYKIDISNKIVDHLIDHDILQYFKVPNLFFITNTIGNNRNPSEFEFNCYSFLQSILFTEEHLFKSNIGLSEEKQYSYLINQFSSIYPFLIDSVASIKNLAKYRVLLESYFLTHSYDTDLKIQLLEKWEEYRRSSTNDPHIDDLLKYLLSSITDGGDQHQLAKLLHEKNLPHSIINHKMVDRYMRMSAFMLPFKLLPNNQPDFIEFQNQINSAGENEVFVFPEKYGKQSKWIYKLDNQYGVFIVRLALHLQQIVEFHKFPIFIDISSASPLLEYFLPGIGANPLKMQGKDYEAWWLCDCKQLNLVGNCGFVTKRSICVKCKNTLGTDKEHVARPGVRKATLEDFVDPRGIGFLREPSRDLAYHEEGLSVIESRVSILIVLLLVISSISREKLKDNNQLVNLGDNLEETELNNFISKIYKFIIINLQVLSELIKITEQTKWTKVEEISFFHKFLNFIHNKATTNPIQEFQIPSNQFRNKETRKNVEKTLGRMMVEFMKESLESSTTEATNKIFEEANKHHEQKWGFQRTQIITRNSIKHLFAREPELQNSYKWINLLLTEPWCTLLDNLVHLYPSFIFIHFLKQTFQSQYTENQLLELSVQDSLDKIINFIRLNKIKFILPNGEQLSHGDQLLSLFNHLASLWNKFATMPQKSFLARFDCQEVNKNLRLESSITLNTKVLHLLPGSSEQSENYFISQLLSDAFQSANSILALDIFKSVLSNHDKSLKIELDKLFNFHERNFIHISKFSLDDFLLHHSINENNLFIADSFAKSQIFKFGAQFLVTDFQFSPEPFLFKSINSAKYEDNILTNTKFYWKNQSLPPHIYEEIIKKLEQNRILPDTKEIFVTVLACSTSQKKFNSQSNNEAENELITKQIQNLQEKHFLSDEHQTQLVIESLSEVQSVLQVKHLVGLIRLIRGKLHSKLPFNGILLLEQYCTALPSSELSGLHADLRANHQFLNGLKDLGTIIKNKYYAPSEDIPVNLRPESHLSDAIMAVVDDPVVIPAYLKMEHLANLLFYYQIRLVD